MQGNRPPNLPFTMGAPSLTHSICYSQRDLDHIVAEECRTAFWEGFEEGKAHEKRNIHVQRQMLVDMSTQTPDSTLHERDIQAHPPLNDVRPQPSVDFANVLDLATSSTNQQSTLTPQMYYCQPCTTGFDTEIELQTHVDTEHNTI